MIGAAEIIKVSVEQLRHRGVNPREQVRAGDQAVNIVTDTAIYEVRSELKDAILRDVIEVLQAARDELDPSLKIVTVGRLPEIGTPTFATLAEAKAAGVTVNFGTSQNSSFN